MSEHMKKHEMHMEQIVPGVLMEKKWFTDITDTASLNRQIQANDELRKAMTDYLSKLQTPELF